MHSSILGFFHGSGRTFSLEHFVLLVATREFFEEEDSNTMYSLNFISKRQGRVSDEHPLPAISVHESYYKYDVRVQNHLIN